MKFICDQCKSELGKSPVRLESFWSKAVTQARLHLHARQFDNAIVYYGNALEASEALLPRLTFSRNAINRYLKTGMEMIFALRKGGYHGDLDAMIASMNRTLQGLMLPAPSDEYLQPLRDVADNSICVVDVWIKSMLSDGQSAAPKAFYH